jgi:tripartite motif-containing protein 71
MKKKLIIIGLIIISIINLMMNVWGHNDTCGQLTDSHITQPSLSYVFLKKWGSRGDRDGQLGGPGKVAVDKSDNVYVSDFNNRRIQKFDSEGNFILKWGSRGENDGQFINPGGITVDFKDYVYVVDMYNHRIQKFDSQGKFILKLGSRGSGEGQFDRLEHIVSDQKGYIYVVDSGNDLIKHYYDAYHLETDITSRIQKFDSKGKFINQYYFSSYIISFAINPIGYVFLSTLEVNHYNVCRYKSLKGTYPEIDPNNYLGDNLKYFSKEFVRSYLTTDKEGNLFVLDRGYTSSDIYKFDCDGNVLTGWDLSGSGDGHCNHPDAIAVDSKENVYILDKDNNCIQKFKPVYYCPVSISESPAAK